MGDISRMVPLLPVRHEGKRRLFVKGPLGEDGEQEHLHLWDRQPWSFFFNLRHMRTRKKWARIQSVI
jgi:hypothetical protein